MASHFQSAPSIASTTPSLYAESVSTLTPDHPSTATTKPSKFAKLNPFAKSKETDHAPLIHSSSSAATQDDLEKHRKEKELIMKYRKMTDQQAEQYMAQKKEPRRAGERRLQGIGSSIASGWGS